MTAADTATLTAYAVGWTEGWSIEPAPPRRVWMDRMHDGFPYRCLPLVIANQLGWIIRSPVGLDAVWNGVKDASGVDIRFDEGTHPHHERTVLTHFGGGVLTFAIPWLFRTDPGVALWVGGVPNEPRPGAFALEGVVETDWAPYTFTMNYRLTDIGRPVRFEPGEPICAIRPVSLGTLEEITFSERPISDSPSLEAEFESWRQKRNAFNARDDRTAKEWQRNYFAGRRPDDAPAGDPFVHRSRLRLHGQGASDTPERPA